MGRSPCCENAHTNKGAWTKQEDQCLINYIRLHGEGCWRSLPKSAGLLRCGKSCRLRWINYLRPDVKRGNFTDEEEEIIIKLHSLLGNKWSLIAGRLPGRTDNEIKNYWNTHVKRKLINRGIDPTTHCQYKATAITTANKVHSNICQDFRDTTTLPSIDVDQNKFRLTRDLPFEDTKCSSGTTMETQAPLDVNLELSIGLPVQSKSSLLSSAESKFWGVAPLLQIYPASIVPVVKKEGVCLCWQLGFQNDQLCLNCQMRSVIT